MQALFTVTSRHTVSYQGYTVISGHSLISGLQTELYQDKMPRPHLQVNLDRWIVQAIDWAVHYRQACSKATHYLMVQQQQDCTLDSALPRSSNLKTKSHMCVKGNVRDMKEEQNEGGGVK